MSQQLTFADSEFSSKRRQTRKEIFLSRMDNLLPWTQLLEVIEPFYPKAGNGRRPYPLETMFRIHCMQQWYSLSDEAMEDALYDKEIFLSRMDNLLPWTQLLEVIEPFYPKAGNGRRPYPLETMFRIHCMQQWYSLSDEAMEDALYEIASMRQFAQLSLDKAIPDRTTIMNFRHLLEKHKLTRKLFQTVNQWLSDCGVMMTQGTLVDATIIQAPSSTKNKKNERDPDMHQTKKGNEWHFGMKAHIGVDAK
ncbi:IS5 family transposase, partial [Shewanella sp. Isolate7]|uniref:IS5 family transposase n=1 Tax=Shewanella sp. Isolate7 TaxID=2908528 RepID=UPI001EFDB0B5